MGGLSVWHWLIVIAVAVLLFGGKGKITSIMGDFAKGIKAFKSGMKEPEEDAAANPPPQVPPPSGAQPAAGPAPGNATASAASYGVQPPPRA